MVDTDRMDWFISPTAVHSGEPKLTVGRTDTVFKSKLCTNQFENTNLLTNLHAKSFGCLSLLICP